MLFKCLVALDFLKYAVIDLSSVAIHVREDGECVSLCCLKVDNQDCSLFLMGFMIRFPIANQFAQRPTLIQAYLTLAQLHIPVPPFLLHE